MKHFPDAIIRRYQQFLNTNPQVKPRLSTRKIILILMPIAYFLGAKLAIHLTVMPNGGPAILWPPNGILLAALIILGKRDFWPLALLAITAEIAADVPDFSWQEALLFGINNVIEVSIAFFLLARWRFNWQFSTLSDLLKFIIAGLIIGAFIGALGGAIIYSIFLKSDPNFLELLRILWLGDALGIMIFTPLLLGLRPQLNYIHSPLSLHYSDLVITLAGFTILILFIMTQNGEAWGVHIGPTLLLPFIIFIAVRLGFRWAAIATAIVAMIIMIMMVNGQKPFGDLASREAVIRGQEFIFTMSLLALGSSALLYQLRAKQSDLEKANQALNQFNQTLEDRVAERTAALEKLNVELERLTQIDFLTNIFNRRAFMDRAQLEMARSRRYGMALSILIFDIDHFKLINDQYGHHVGDRVLQWVAALAAAHTRTADTLARYGGEEFVLLMPETDLVGAETLAQRILQTLRSNSLPTEQGVVQVAASFGITEVKTQQETLEDALQRADRALYRAKAQGRNCVIVADSP